MLNDSEKRKGLPRISGVAYLIGGIIIGGFGVLAVMFFLTMPACACTPAPTPTFTVPYIPTPNPGATGTAAAARAQTAEERLQLRDFVVDEIRGQIGLMYDTSSDRMSVEVRAWSKDGVGDVVNVLSYGSISTYSNLAFLPERSALIASSSNRSTIFDIDDTRSPVERRVEQSLLYSPDGQWLVGWDTHQLRLLEKNSFGTLMQVIYDGFWAEDAAFSPDGTQIAIIGQDTDRANRVYIEIYDLPTLTRAASYDIESGNGAFDSRVLLTPDHRSVIALLRDTIYVFDLASSQERYFEGPPFPFRAAVDASGRWLAVDGPGDTVTESSILLYDLQETNHLAPEPPKTYVLKNIPPHKQFQFLSDGLLVGHDGISFTLYHWTGETWGDPKVVLTAEDLH
jgi:WD40 repeat protein